MSGNSMLCSSGTAILKLLSCCQPLVWFTFLYQIKLSVWVKKGAAGKLGEMSEHRGMSADCALNKVNHVLDQCFTRQQHFIAVVYNYGPTALPPTNTPAVSCSQFQRRIGARLHCCCHKASAITSYWRKGNDCHQDKYQCVTNLTQTPPFGSDSTSTTL